MAKTKLDILMREIGITNTGLAALTGLHRKTIQEAREGIVKQRYSTWKKISRVTGVSVYELQKIIDREVNY